MDRFFTVVLICGFCASPAWAQTRQRPIRFAAMDVNNDGVITQREWRGSTAAFEAEDWNADGILSGDEVSLDANRTARGQQRRTPERTVPTDTFHDWTSQGFTDLDDDRNGRISRNEWHFDVESFRRADHNGDGSLSRREFLGEAEDATESDQRFPNPTASDQRLPYVDTNGDGRISRAEWRGTAERFDVLDNNRDGQLTEREMAERNGRSSDEFAEADANGDGSISRREWGGSRATFDSRDGNEDGRLTRQEFAEAPSPSQTGAWRAGHERGLVEGRQSGTEDRERRQGWDLEGQRELETADAGYEARLGSKVDYQNGYRDGFRRGYREGWGPR